MYSTMKASFIILFFFMLSITLSACEGTPAGNVADGKRWFAMQNCSACHGPNANDGDAVNIANLDQSFGSFLRKLRTKDAPIMPPFPEEKVSKQDAADIYAFLKSL